MVRETQEHILTLQEAAALMRMSYRTARRRVQDRKPPFDRAFRDGGRWLVPRVAVERVLAGNGQQDGQ